MIRHMVDSDWPAVAEIYGSSIDAGDATFRTELPSFEEWDRSHQRDCRLVFEKDGAVMGFAAISPMSGTPSYWGSVDVSIYVSRDHRGEHIGTDLLNALIADTESRRYWSLCSVIFSSNTASIHMHEKCGFRIIGTRDRPARDRFGNWVDTTLMERRSDKIV